MGISIKLIDSSCMEKLFEFELLNRQFFEKTCPSRVESYYEVKNFKRILEEASSIHSLDKIVAGTS